LNGWVTVTNKAGTTFKDTALKLVAGDVHRVREEVKRIADVILCVEEAVEEGQFKKEYVYDDIPSWWWYGSDWSDTSEKKVDVMLNFNNSEENNLGIPLLKGTVRVFTNDKEGKLQIIG